MKNGVKFLCICWVNVLFMSYSNPVFAQQISIHRSQGTYQWTGLSRTFNDRFQCSNPYFITIDSSEAYKSKRIKKVEILSPDSTLTWMMSFDSSGHLLKTGMGGLSCKYFRVWHNQVFSNGESQSTTEYYENKILKRMDSGYSGIMKVRIGDTVFLYRYSIEKVYRKGALLNEHGAYINDRQRQVPEGMKYAPWHHRLKYRVKKTFKYAFKRKYKTSYEDDSMYLSNEYHSMYCVGFTLGPDTSEAINANVSKQTWMKHHNYAINYFRCENYYEKVSIINLPGCYTDKARHDEEQRHLNDGVQYAKNSMGLNVCYYKDGYPVFYYRYTFYE